MSPSCKSTKYCSIDVFLHWKMIFILVPPTYGIQCRTQQKQLIRSKQTLRQLDSVVQAVWELFMKQGEIADWPSHQMSISFREWENNHLFWSVFRVSNCNVSSWPQKEKDASVYQFLVLCFLVHSKPPLVGDHTGICFPLLDEGEDQITGITAAMASVQSRIHWHCVASHLELSFLQWITAAQRRCLYTASQVNIKPGRQVTEMNTLCSRMLNGNEEGLPR